MKKTNNYAFIDTQNLNLGIKSLGWKLDLKRFRNYLRQEYGVVKAYMFIGYMPEHNDLYDAFRNAGFDLMFKPLAQTGDQIKGNIDADLVLQVMLDKELYNKAVIITSDGDFHNLVTHLYNTNRLETVISPNRMKCSLLLQQAAQEKIAFLNELRSKLEYRYVARKNRKQNTQTAND